MTTVKGGLPVLVSIDFEIADPERGIMSEDLAIEWIAWRSGRKITPKVFETISKDDLERIYLEAWDIVLEEQEKIQSIKRYGYDSCFDAGYL